MIVKCIICNKEFERRDVASRRIKRSLRPAKSVTCSKPCSRKYQTIRSHVISVWKHNQKLKAKETLKRLRERN